MGREAGYFKTNDPRRGPGGRKAMPAELREALEAATPDAVETLRGIITDPEARQSDKIRAAEVILDRAWGKPTQALDVTADIDAEAKINHLDGMSLSERGKAMQKAMEAYGKMNN